MQRINGEMIAGISLVILAILFIYAGMVNEVWKTVMIADFVILAIGIGFIALGVRTVKHENWKESHPGSEQKSGYY